VCVGSFWRSLNLAARPVKRQAREVRSRLWIQPVVATLLLLAQSSLCCNDRLNPEPEAGIVGYRDCLPTDGLKIGSFGPFLVSEGRCKLMRQLALLAVIALYCGCSTGISKRDEDSSQIDTARAAVDRGEYASALQIAQPLAQHGFAPAQTLLAEMYLDGQGVARDPARAMSLYRQAADQGDGRAENGIGLMYDTGNGVALNYQEAFAWYTKAAQRGYPGGINNLGTMYAKGLGVEWNEPQATALYEKAAALGYVTAQLNLGTRFVSGDEVTQDCARGMAWYNKAASEGSAQAEYEIGSLYEKAQCVPRDMSMAADWLLKASEHRHAMAMNNLGILYQKGDGVRRDLVIAYALYTVSATLDSSGDNYAPGNVVKIEGKMSDDQLRAGQDLAKALSQDGKFREVLAKAAQ
jgi:TPR repeat protein